jgi:hypothetical protein
MRLAGRSMKVNSSKCELSHRSCRTVERIEPLAASAPRCFRSSAASASVLMIINLFRFLL